MTKQDLSIGRVAAATGANVQTIRYYEQIGLMPPPVRTEGGQRRYSDKHIRRLAFIRNARDLGFSVEAIERLLDLANSPDRPCAEVLDVAEAQLAAVRSRMLRLRSLERELTLLVRSCRGGSIRECRIVEALSKGVEAGASAPVDSEAV